MSVGPGARRSALVWIWLAIVVVSADQITKALAVAHLTLYVAHPVCPFFNLTLAYNRGAAFSMLSTAGGWQRWLFMALAVGAATMITLWLRDTPAPRRWLAGALALILGGAVGNLIDRIVLGHVVDFIEVYYRTWYFPAFNVADSAISVGAAMLLIDLLGQRESESGA